MNTPHNSEFKQPNLLKYDNAMGVLVEHLINFKSKLIVHSYDGALICKLFPETLPKVGFRWFREHKLKSTTS